MRILCYDATQLLLCWFSAAAKIIWPQIIAHWKYQIQAFILHNVAPSTGQNWVELLPGLRKHQWMHAW